MTAYFETMKTTGLAVAFTGITLAAGVLTWIFSEIKFQADMGLLLTFMFLWNMVGAVVLIPRAGGGDGHRAARERRGGGGGGAGAGLRRTQTGPRRSPG